MATHPVPDCYYAGMVTPLFDLEQLGELVQYGHESFHPTQSNRQHLIYSRKRLEARLLSLQHQNMHHVVHFLVYNVLAKIQLLLAEIFSTLCFDPHTVTPYDVIST